MWREEAEIPKLEQRPARILLECFLINNIKNLPDRKLLYVLVSNSPVVSDESGFIGNEIHLYSFSSFQFAAPIQVHSLLGMILKSKKNY